MNKVLMVDNYDSFTFNIVQYLGELNAEVMTYRNDEITLAQMEALGHDFYVFMHMQTNSCGVVYRRKDGNIGWIDPRLIQ